MRLTKKIEIKNISEKRDYLQNITIEMWRTQHTGKFSFGGIR